MSEPEPGMPPQEEARVRRLLAEARHSEPLPSTVADRLELVLEQLAAAEPGVPARGAAVVDLVARRRHRVTMLLVAAAAVVVAGVGIGQVVRDEPVASSSAGAASDSKLSAPEATSAEAGSADMATGPNAPPTGARSGEPTEIGPPLAVEPAPVLPTAPKRLTKKGFADEVARFQHQTGYLATAGTPVAGADLSTAEAFVCPAADWGDGTLFAALYNDVSAVLAYRPPMGATQTVELLRCGTGDPLRSTVLPVP